MNYHSFNPVESPPSYSSIILPTCQSIDYRIMRTTDSGMNIFNYIDVHGSNIAILNAMECFASEKNADCFERLALRLSQFREFPYFLYNNVTSGNTYHYDLRKGEKNCLGKTIRTENYVAPQKGEVALVYGNKVREIGNCPLMQLGYISAHTPGLHEAIQTKIQLETKLLL